MSYLRCLGHLAWLSLPEFLLTSRGSSQEAKVMPSTAWYPRTALFQAWHVTEFTKSVETNLQENYKRGPREVSSTLAQSRTQPAQPMEKKLALSCQGMKESNQNTLPFTLHPPGWSLFPGQSYISMLVHTSPWDWQGHLRNFQLRPENNQWLSRKPATGRAGDSFFLGLEPLRFWIWCSRGSGLRSWISCFPAKPSAPAVLEWERTTIWQWARGSLTQMWVHQTFTKHLSCARLHTKG